MPVLLGRDAREVMAVFTGREGEYLESRRQLGISLERVYATPDMAVAYVEAAWDYDTLRRAMAQSEREADRAYAAQLLAVHGIDLEQAEPEPRLLGEWLDPAVTKHHLGLAFAARLAPGQAAAAGQLAEDAFGHRRYENMMSRRAAGIVAERIFLAGDLVAFYIEADDPGEALWRLRVSQTVHDRWFKDQVKDICEGLDLDEPLAVETVWDQDLEAVPA